MRNVANLVTTADTGIRAPLEIGSMVHVCLAVHYARRLPQGYPGWQAHTPSPLELLDALVEEGVDAACAQEVRRVVYAYLEFYDDTNIFPVAVEHGAGIPGIHTCRYDMLGWQDNALWVYEHKCLAIDKEDTIESWWLDGEILGELYAYRLSNLQATFGAPLAGVQMNLLFKTRPPKFRRIPIVVPENVMNTYIRDRNWWTGFRNNCQQTGCWPRALSGCINKYDRCAYWAHCRDEDSSILVPKGK
jgi:hypothetical protein